MTRFFFLLLLIFTLPTTLLSKESESELEDDRFAETEQVIKRLKDQVEELVLSNGIKVSIYRRKATAPVFSGVVTVRVGGVDEQLGKTGLAHLFEHMAFKGTKEIGTRDYNREKKLLVEEQLLRSKKLLKPQEQERLLKVEAELNKIWRSEEFTQLLDKRGADNLNATTDKDLTNYYESLPSSAFEFWCWIESERILNPVFRQFYKERDVVMEERRMRYDDDPWGKLYESLLKVAFLEHPYRNPVIGYKEDIENINPSDLSNLHSTYYVGRNIAISIVGDIDPDEVKEKVKYYFERIPEGAEPPRTRIVEPLQSSERAVNVYSDKKPRAIIAYHKPVYPDLDDPAITLMGNILAVGNLSRLYNVLVEEKRLLADIDYSEGPGTYYPNLFYFLLTPIAEKSIASSLKTFNYEVERFRNNGPTDWELNTAKQRLAMDYINEIESDLDLARNLASSHVLYGNWEAFFDWYDEMLQVTSNDIIRVAQLYLDPANRTIATLSNSSVGQHTAK
jgi:predicted Zn-dependent peptidase